MDLDTFLQDPKVLPNYLFILPLSIKPVFPGLFCPLVVTGEKDIEVVTRAISTGGMIGALLEKEAHTSDNQKREDTLYTVGTMCKILKS
ncbi:LON peptidase substrate-binding domain-containing protein, partial [Bullifex porci]